MSPYITLLILCAVSALLLALAFFSPWHKQATGLCLLWLAASLPIMYFSDFSRNFILLFYLISAAAGLVYLAGGEKK